MSNEAGSGRVILMPENGERRLPVYFLLDTSGSMEAGDAIKEVVKGLQIFVQEMVDDPQCRETVYVRVITYGSTATAIGDGLTAVEQFKVPQLTATGQTRLDLAFDTLVTAMDSDVVLAVRGGQRGDWLPIVFVLTDGRPTDQRGWESDELWPAARERVVKREAGRIRPSAIHTIGVGLSPNKQQLKAISTGHAFLLESERQGRFIDVFRWVTQSIARSIRAGGNPDQDQSFGVSTPYEGIEEVP